MNSFHNDKYYDSPNKEDSDFWDDIEPSSDFKIHYNNNQYIDQSEKKDRKEYLYNKYNFLIEKFDHTSKKERLKTEGSEEEANRCNSLYQHAKERMKYLNKVRKENENRRLDNELNECTFQPNLNKSPYRKKLNNSTLYERNKRWLVNKQENLVRARRRHSDDLRNAFNYTPLVNQLTDAHAAKIFNEENNIVNQPENYYYLVRQYQARQSKEKNKKKKKDNDIYLNTSHYSHNSKRKVSNDYIAQFKTHIHQEILSI